MLSPTETLLINCAFTLALCLVPALKDSITNSPIKLIDVNYNFSSIFFTMSQGPSYEESKTKFLSWLSTRNNCASSKQQVSFFFYEHCATCFPQCFFFFFLWWLQTFSQMCDLSQANLDNFMAVLNSSHLSFFCFPALPSQPPSIYFLLQFI